MATNFYEAEQSPFRVPTIITNNSGLKVFVQNESGWCELRAIEAKCLTPVSLTDVEWEAFHALVKEETWKDLPKQEPKAGWDYSKGITFI